MPSTRSSADPPGDDSTRRPSRAAIAALVVASLAIPAGVLALIVTREPGHGRASPVPSVPTTDVAPIDASRARVGSIAPDFTLEGIDGASVRLSGLRGHPVVIAFFASWCQPCEEELPVLERFAQEAGERMQVIGVSFKDLRSDSVAFVKELHVTFPALLDEPSAPVAERYGVRGIPQTVFVDQRGVVRGRVYGETSRSGLAPAIDDLLNGRNIRPV